VDYIFTTNRTIMNQEDIKQDKEIEEIRGMLDKKVPWVYMVAFVTLFLIAVGWMFSAVSVSQTKADNAIGRISKVEGNIQAINTKLVIMFDYFKLTPKQQARLKN